jgi:hypothetical protein
VNRRRTHARTHAHTYTHMPTRKIVESCSYAFVPVGSRTAPINVLPPSVHCPCLQPQQLDLRFTDASDRCACVRARTLILSVKHGVIARIGRDPCTAARRRRFRAASQSIVREFYAYELVSRVRVCVLAYRTILPTSWRLLAPSSDTSCRPTTCRRCCPATTSTSLTSGRPSVQPSRG